jgi:hypothetical protein
VQLSRCIREQLHGDGEAGTTKSPNSNEGRTPENGINSSPEDASLKGNDWGHCVLQQLWLRNHGAFCGGKQCSHLHCESMT